MCTKARTYKHQAQQDDVTTNVTIPHPTHPIPDKQHQGQEDDTKTRSETAHGLLEALTPKTYPCWRNFITSDSCQKDASYCHIYDLWLLFPDEFTGGSLHPRDIFGQLRWVACARLRIWKCCNALASVVW